MSGGSRTGLVLAPGASATRDHSALVAIDKAVSADGVIVSRIDLPRSGKAERMVGVVEAAASQLAEQVDRVVLGGRSLGGRVGSLAAAGGWPTAGLALVSYPLHPPGKPEQLRTAHFPALTMPCLFVSGTRDTFGTPAQLEAATAAIPGPVTHIWIEGGDHGLRGKDGPVAEAVRDWLRSIGAAQR